MDALEYGIWSFPVLLLLIFLRLPIGPAMLVVGIVGSCLINGNVTVVLSQLKHQTYGVFSNYALAIVPLFLLMGHFAGLGGMSRALFRAADAWLGHFRGGMAMATIGACAGFGAICGSSLATAATMGKVALPELRRAGYANHLATGTLAAGGTLGILIPPSVALVIYAIISEQNIAKLFVAAMVPGILAAAGYMLAVACYVRLRPDAAIRRQPIPYGARFRALLAIWPVLGLFLLVVGGIYLGFFTPSEAAAIGAAGTGLIALVNRALNRERLRQAILDTARTTGMIFLIILGAAVYNGFLARAQLPQEAAAFVVEQGLSPWLTLSLMLAFYLIFGCVMDSLSMILLTVPIFFPIAAGLDFGLPAEEFALWFGILVLIAVEVGLITPPVGMNLFVVNTLAPGVPLAQTYRGVLPFVITDLIRLLLLALFPIITLSAIRWLY